jgi:hypothetical protein
MLRDPHVESKTQSSTARPGTPVLSQCRPKHYAMLYSMLCLLRRCQIGTRLILIGRDLGESFRNGLLCGMHRVDDLLSIRRLDQPFIHPAPVKHEHELNRIEM